MDDSLQNRGKAIEDLFFKQQDQELLAKLRAEIQAKETRAGLSLTSVSLIPLVAL